MLGGIFLFLFFFFPPFPWGVWEGGRSSAGLGNKTWVHKALIEGWILQPSLLVGDIKFRSLFKMCKRCMKRCLKLLLVWLYYIVFIQLLSKRFWWIKEKEKVAIIKITSVDTVQKYFWSTCVVFLAAINQQGWAAGLTMNGSGNCQQHLWSWCLSQVLEAGGWQRWFPHRYLSFLHPFCEREML